MALFRKAIKYGGITIDWIFNIHTFILIIKDCGIIKFFWIIKV